MIRWASTGPIPGSASRSATVAVLRSTGPAAAAPEGPAPDAPAPDDPGVPTAICCPSETTAARLTAEASVPGTSPPAAATASATREPVGTVTRPGWTTRPTTETTTVADVRPAFPTAGE